MKKLESLQVDVHVLREELERLEEFLGRAPHLQERRHVLPFFKQHRHLSASLGMLAPHIAVPELYASELQLFGDFVCDAVSGDRTENAFALIEFEDANQHSIFKKLAVGKSIKSYSPRFERGFSQLVDWAWRLSSECNSEGFARIFGTRDARLNFMLVIGRDDDLTEDDRKRLRWRAQNVSLGSIPMQCLTFDQVLRTLRRRLKLANAASTVT